MASKGQKHRKYTEELKQTILNEYYEGITGVTELSKKYNVPYKTIINWIDKINNPQRFLTVSQKRGRPKDSTNDWKERY